MPTIREWRQRLGMSQRQFSAFFGIPLGTLRNWEQGINSPPEYVFSMLLTSIRRDGMLNVETMKFMKLMDELSERMQNGLVDFSEATEKDVHVKLFYYEEAENREDGNRRFRIVEDSCVIDDPKCLHHDVISYYGGEEDGYVIYAVIPADGNEAPFIEVTFEGFSDYAVIEPGRWYFC